MFSHERNGTHTVLILLYQGDSSTQSNEAATIVSLKEQNDALRSVIQKMREEMESITAASSHQEKDKMAGSSFTEGKFSLRVTEIHRIKPSCRVNGIRHSQ